MRRNLLIAAAVAAVIAIGSVVAVALTGDDDESAPAAPDATSTSIGGGDTEFEDTTTTTEQGAPVTSPGSAPVSGAILSQAVDEPGPAVDVGEETDCKKLDSSFAPLGCSRVEGSGGDYLVFVGRRGDGALQSRLYRAKDDGETEFTLVRRSKVFEPDRDLVAMSLNETEVGGERVVVVDYDFGGSGAVHSFDVVAWDSADEGPRVVAFVNGNGGDRAVPSPEGLRFVGANFDDGAPTCCPNYADVRTLTHPKAGAWDITTRKVAFSEAP